MKEYADPACMEFSLDSVRPQKENGKIYYLER